MNVSNIENVTSAANVSNNNSLAANVLNVSDNGNVNVPDKRSRILEVVVVRRIFNLGTGNLEWGGNGKGLRKGRSVYELPETKVDGSCHSKEGSK